MELALGKLKNKDTGEELPFSMNPTEYHLTRGFDYSVEPRLGQTTPMVSFRSGNASELSCHLIYDQDADTQADLKKVQTFLHGLNQIQAKTKSTPVVEFTMGSFTFSGYVRQFSFHPTRFNAKAEPTSARLDFSIVSNGDYENEKK